MDAKQVVEKLKSSINKSIAEKFSVNVLLDNKFIPINAKNNTLYVAVVDTSDKQRLTKILTDVKALTDYNPVAINITKEQFNELMKTIDTTFSLGVTGNVLHSENSQHIIQYSDKPQEEVKTNDEIGSVATATVPTKSNESSQPKKRLGDMLVDKGLITKEQLFETLATCKETKEPIGSALVKAGYITLAELRETLSQQQGINTVETTNLKIDPKVTNLLPEDFVKDNKIIPISSDGKTLTVGMVNPNNKDALNDIIYLTGLKPQALIITHIEYESCLETLYESKKITNDYITEINLEDDIVEDKAMSQLERELQDDSSAVAKFVNQIVANAITKGASDIHIEPRAKNYIVRYRTDGILKQVLEIPSKIESSIVSRIKVVARMNIAEHRRPQDGVFSITVGNLTYDLRVNTLPVDTKEKIVIRVLKPTLESDSDNKTLQLNGGRSVDILKVNNMISSPHGILLVSGPTGSGKTTTLYSILSNINDEMINITTIEDPIEIKLEGVNQVQVNAKADVTFASCMRAILRQDPDVIMVGEIRDQETLEIAIKAALTGHFVLSTIHTNSAVETLTRLVEMGAQDYLVASALIGVVAQRLVRHLCPHCKETYRITDEELAKIVTNPEAYSKFKEKDIYKAKGCNKCDFTGYSGRLGLYEVLPINRELKKMISQSSSIIDIEEAAISGGMRTLSQACLDHIYDGETTVSEFIRVLGIVND